VFRCSLAHVRLAIEGTVGLGALLAGRLREDGIAVTGVPARLARRVWLIFTGHGRKNDQASVLSAAWAGWIRVIPALASAFPKAAP
jgi:hypothetical protein